jgi:hypothetical protein
MRINALSTGSSNGRGGGRGGGGGGEEEEEEEDQEVRKSNDEEEIGEINQGEEEQEEGEERKEDILAYAGELLEPEGWIVLMSCAIGVMTGVGVVLFNLGVSLKPLPCNANSQTFKSNDTHWRTFQLVLLIMLQPIQFW